MSKIIKCDRCGITSPDKKGLYIANHWTVIKTSHNLHDQGVGGFRREWHKIELCLDCTDAYEKFLDD